ncbi:centromere protein X-like protein [Absidia repens]|uniref:Centromere protein X-like protein n=1 Tax=Absidia repens TaxID=90262 RepID=A0A1X2IR23_9FUNG|nr:centromere protein X-like protein [Absidia repens]
MNDEVTYSTDTVQAVMKSAWKDPRTKANSQAVQLSAEFFKLFTIEAIHRASEEAKQISDRSDEVQVEHLERILPQLLLDF